MSNQEQIYGQFAVGPPGSVPTMHADRMMGFRIGRTPDGQIAGIDLQFETKGQPQSLTIPILDALALLGMLKSMQLNEDMPFPEDPRDPNWKASDYKKKS